MTAARISTVSVGPINLTVTHAGDGPCVVLLHGFPEVGYSWRHQIPVLAEAGYRVLAPDQRGCGWSEAPTDRAAYGIADLVADVIGLLDAESVDQAVVVGHDVGALVAPWVALFRPDRVRALALMSLPYIPRSEQSIVEHVRTTDPDGEFAYILAFQQPGIEQAFESNPIEALRRFHWTLSGARPDDIATNGIPSGLPPHLSQGEIENYYRAFARSGFASPMNVFRNFESNWDFTRPWHKQKLTVPTVFIAGERDHAVSSSDGMLGASIGDMRELCSDLRGVHVLEGVGHWVQQEAPDVVNQLLLAFLRDL